MPVKLPIAMVHVSPLFTVFANDGVPLNTTRFCVVAVESCTSLSAHVCAGAFVIVIAVVFAFAAADAAVAMLPFNATPPTAPPPEEEV